jgi:hypothetical protein
LTVYRNSDILVPLLAWPPVAVAEFWTLGLDFTRMKNQFAIIATLTLFLAGCATTLPTRLTSTVDVRKMSYADERLFRDLLTEKGGVGFAECVIFPRVKEGKITSIEAIVPYDNHKTGVERWTVQHDGQDTCSYIVKFIPDGHGGTQFTVQQDDGTIKL